MTTRTPSSATPASRRPLAIAVIDIAVGVVIAIIGLAISFGVLYSASQYAQLPAANAGLLSTITIVLTAIAIFGWAVPAGMLVVRALQRRYAFYWPIIGIIIVVISFYVCTYFVSTVVTS